MIIIRIHSLTYSLIALATQSEYIKSFATLELFAYGTYFDFVANRNRYLELTSEQGNKLRLLSIVSLASANHELHYSTLKGDSNISIHIYAYLLIHSTQRTIIHN